MNPTMEEAAGMSSYFENFRVPPVGIVGKANARKMQN